MIPLMSHSVENSKQNKTRSLVREDALARALKDNILKRKTQKLARSAEKKHVINEDEKS